MSITSISENFVYFIFFFNFSISYVLNETSYYNSLTFLFKDAIRKFCLILIIIIKVTNNKIS